jgi:hypothetical protein
MPWAWRSRIVFSQFLKHDIPQMVQAFTKLQWINQRSAATIIVVKPLQVGACDQERGNPPAIIADPDFGQIAAHA